MMSRLFPHFMASRFGILSKTPLLAAVILGGGCVFYPQTTLKYDPACDTLQRHMTLNSTQVEAFVGCHDRACAELLVLAGVVSAASFVVSGSIAVVGDIVYWLEAQAQCGKAGD